MIYKNETHTGICQLSKTPFIEYAEILTEQMHKLGFARRSENYRSAVNSLKKYLDGNNPDFAEITPDFLQGYEQWLRAKSLCRNTTSYYMRNLRAIFNHASDIFNSEIRDPFRKVYTGVDKTRKRSLASAELRLIKNADLRGKPHLSKARDIFLLSYCLRGMSFVDMAFLHKSDLRDNALLYKRRKTGQTLLVAWEPQMQNLAQRIGAPPSSPFLLDIIRNPDCDHRKQYISASHSTNRCLRKIGESAGLEFPLTMYVARHTWASEAYKMNIPVAVISESLGHTSESTTRIYLNDLGNNVIDEANRHILAHLGSV